MFVLLLKDCRRKNPIGSTRGYPKLFQPSNLTWLLRPSLGSMSKVAPKRSLPPRFSALRLKRVNDNECVTGWDSSAWVLGAAVAAQADWVVIVDTNNTLGIFSRNESRRKRQELAYPPNETELIAESQVQELGAFIANVLPGILRLLGNASIQEVGYGLVTNPFLGYDKSEAGLQEQATLALVDAGESGQETPIWPLIQPVRKMDFLLVSDSSGVELSSGWMNGTNLINTAAMAIANDVPFPKLPDVNTFLINNYTLAPVFFGCNEPEVPLLLYVADAPHLLCPHTRPNWPWHTITMARLIGH
ncbi:acyl transferase/acyl hydrolase/lysophospholipase [Mycena sanguinolenta]|nr:acyl transferase/acyl hydrolase/lysophospholipase [Mycena sanguinolenta]